MTDRRWIEAFAAELGLDPPTDREWELVLQLAGCAAHASQRTAAPLACWLGAASGRGLEELLAIAERIPADEAA
jgi:hypothetical protein